MNDLKVKNSVEKISMRAIMLIFAAAAVVLTVLRAVGVFSLIDASTGFYKESSFAITSFNILLVLFCGGLIVTSFLSKETGSFVALGYKSGACFGASCFMAVAMFYDCVSSLSASGKCLAGADYYDSAFRMFMSSGALPQFLRSIFALLSAVYFIFLCVSYKKGSRVAGGRKIIALAPVAWAAFRMVSLFISKISFLRVSDLFLELVLLSLCALFYFAFAQTASEVYSEMDLKWRITGFGLSAAAVAAAVSVTRLAGTIVSAQTFVNAEHPFNLADFAFVFFALAVVTQSVKNRKTKKALTEATEGDA